MEVRTAASANGGLGSAAESPVSCCGGGPTRAAASAALGDLCPDTARFRSLSSNPKIFEVRKTPAEAVSLLVYVDGLPALPQTASFFRRLVGHQQVTDAYLLAGASWHG
jgi:hypothetical protein